MTTEKLNVTISSKNFTRITSQIHKLQHLNVKCVSLCKVKCLLGQCTRVSIRTHTPNMRTRNEYIWTRTGGVQVYTAVSFDYFFFTLPNLFGRCFWWGDVSFAIKKKTVFSSFIRFDFCGCGHRCCWGFSFFVNSKLCTNISTILYKRKNRVCKIAANLINQQRYE